MKTSISIFSPPRSAVEVFKMLPEGTLCEVVENTIYMSPAPAFDHQRILINLVFAFKTFILKEKPGELFIAPFDIFLDEQNAFQPDLIFISKKNKGKLIPGSGFKGVPDLVIEILSPTGKSHDSVKKKRVYEQCGVQEFWIINPKNKEATGFQLRNKEYKKFFSGKGVLKSLLFKKTFRF